MSDVLRAAFNIFLLFAFMVIVLQLAGILPQLCETKYITSDSLGLIIAGNKPRCYSIWNWGYWHLLNSGEYTVRF